MLRDVSTIERCRRCGREIIGSQVVLVEKAGTAHISGVESCGRIWLCPVCSAKIRVRRGDEIAEAVGNWITEGHGCYFITATLPHDAGDALQASLSVLAESWRQLMSGKMAKGAREAYGIVGNIKAVEVTHGRNGWHPHIHAVMLTQEQVPVLELCKWFHHLDRYWAAALLRNGWAEGKQGYRLRLDLVNRSTAAGLAAYVVKVQDGSGLGNEIARADLKNGKKSSRTPMQILADFATWGDVADLELWHEYEAATQGRSALRWSQGLRKLLLPGWAELSDEEIAAEEIGGRKVAYIEPRLWFALVDVPGGESLVLNALEMGGLEAVTKTLIALRLDPSGLVPIEDDTEADDA